MNSLFLNSDSLGGLDEVYSDSGGRSTKVRDDYKEEQEEETRRGRQGSLPTSPVHRTPTPDSPIDYEAAVLRVAEYEELATHSPSPPLQFPTVAPAPPEPWDNLCPDADSNPHQYLVIHTPTGEEWTPYQGEIFSIPAAGNLLRHPPDFPSVFPFFT